MILSGSQSLCFGLSYILAGPCQQVGWLPWQVWKCSQGVLARLGLHDGDGTPPRSWPNSFRPKKCMLARLEPSRIFPNTSSNKQSKRSCFRVVLYYCNREIFPGSESPEISVARTRIDRCSNLPPWGSSKLLSVAPRNQWWRRPRISQILQQRPRGMQQNSGSGQCWACIAWEPTKSLGWILSLWLVYRSCGPQAIWNLSFHFGWLGVYKHIIIFETFPVFSARYYLLNGVLEIMWVPNLFFGPWDLVKIQSKKMLWNPHHVSNHPSRELIVAIGHL